MSQRKRLKNPKTAIFSLGLMIAALIPVAAQAMPSDREKAIKITADAASHSEKTGITVYSGDVYLEQGTLKIWGDKLTIHSTPDGDVTFAEALGEPAKLQQKPAPEKDTMFGEALTIHYKIDGETVVFRDEAHLRQGKAEMKGDYIEYNSQDQLFNAKSMPDTTTGKKTRVQFVLPPKGQMRGEGK